MVDILDKFEACDNYSCEYLKSSCPKADTPSGWCRVPRPYSRNVGFHNFLSFTYFSKRLEKIGPSASLKGGWHMLKEGKVLCL